MKKISVVIPSYNEEASIPLIHDRIRKVFENDLQNYDYEIIFVNDGSTDGSQELLEELSQKFSNIKFIEFSRNFGHQPAVKAGLDNASGDAVVSLDGDLQHPPELIPEMVKQWERGFDIVYTIRTYPVKISKFKKITSDLYYQIITQLSDIHIERKAGADFRLIDKSVLNVVRNMNEDNLFLRGLFKWIGFKQIGIHFVADNRLNGETKYNLNKMMKFAVTGVTAFSVKPLYLSAYIGFWSSLIAVVVYASYVIHAFLTKTQISGWASVIMTVVFFGGMQLCMLGILGIYIGKIFKQVKGRPNYIIRSKNF